MVVVGAPYGGRTIFWVQKSLADIVWHSYSSEAAVRCMCDESMTSLRPYGGKNLGRPHSFFKTFKKPTISRTTH